MKAWQIMLIFLIVLILIFAGIITYFFPLGKLKTDIPSKTAAASIEDRKWTLENCKNLLDYSTKAYIGSVVFEECARGCLGGCNNKKTLNCFYGVQDAKGCLVYVQSRIIEKNYGYFIYNEFIARKWAYGEQVSIKEPLKLYKPIGCTNESCYYIIADENYFGVL